MISKLGLKNWTFLNPKFGNTSLKSDFFGYRVKKIKFMEKIKWDLVETIESKKMERKRKERLKEIKRVRKMVYLLILAFFIYGLYNLVY